MPLLLREWPRLKLKQQVLYRVTSPQDQPQRWQLVLPEKYRKIVLKSLHDESWTFGGGENSWIAPSLVLLAPNEGGGGRILQVMHSLHPAEDAACAGGSVVALAQ